MTKKQNTSIVVDTCIKRLQALKLYVDGKTQIAVNGTRHNVSEIAAIYQSCLDSRAALATKRAEEQAVMAAVATADKGRRDTDRALKAWVAAEFGVDSKEAIDFGFPPRRKAALTVDAKVKAVALAKATRAARHTMGTKQKGSANPRAPQDLLELRILA